MKRILNTDTLLGAVSALGGVFLLIVSHRQNASVFVLPGDAPPFLVPQLFLYVMIALSLAVLASGILRGGEAVPPQRWVHLAAVLAVVAMAAALMKPLGFLVVSPVAVAAVCALLGFRRVLLNIVVALVITVLLYGLLTGLAGLPLPKVPGLGF